MPYFNRYTKRPVDDIPANTKTCDLWKQGIQKSIDLHNSSIIPTKSAE